MTAEPIRLYYDFVDPCSWLLGRHLETLSEATGAVVAWVAVESNAPPQPLLGANDAEVAEWWHRASELSDETLVRPALPFVPWTRKAHELVRLAETEGEPAQTRAAIFEAYLEHGNDIGRVDVLVDVARSVGFDRSHAKAVLDVDRFEPAVAEASAAAQAQGIAPSTVEWRGMRRSGFHDLDTVRTFLGT